MSFAKRTRDVYVDVNHKHGTCMSQDKASSQLVKDIVTRDDNCVQQIETVVRQDETSGPLSKASTQDEVSKHVV
jgi:hypothetical protein